MPLTLLTGGARSGKSGTAIAWARRQDAPVTFLATGEARDDEMAARIARHRAERPAGWATVEEPVRLEAAIAGVAPGACLIVDCLSLWVANVIDRDDEAILAASAASARVAAVRTGMTIVVTNETGMGVVPATPLGRRYRDVLGAVNAQWSRAASRACLVVAGRLLELGEPLA